MNTTFSTIKNPRIMGVHRHKKQKASITDTFLNFSGGDEGIRTLDTVARIPHFQCGALDQLCDVSVSGYSSSADSSTSSTTSSTVSGAISSDANEASNSASISRNNGSSLPISKDSSPSNATGVSL